MRTFWPWKLDFHGFGCFCVFFFCNVFGCNVGHFKTLALIPIDVYVGGVSEPNQTQIKPNKMKGEKDGKDEEYHQTR